MKTFVFVTGGYRKKLVGMLLGAFQSPNGKTKNENCHTLFERLSVGIQTYLMKTLL